MGNKFVGGLVPVWVNWLHLPSAQLCIHLPLVFFWWAQDFTYPPLSALNKIKLISFYASCAILHHLQSLLRRTLHGIFTGFSGQDRRLAVATVELIERSIHYTVFYNNATEHSSTLQLCSKEWSTFFTFFPKAVAVQVYTPYDEIDLFTLWSNESRVTTLFPCKIVSIAPPQ